jgi:KDO2-lipid IV(A) lauroyltransferase
MKRAGPRQWIEAVIAWSVYQLFRAIPLDAASFLGGWLGRQIGYRLPLTRLARSNLSKAYPELDEDARERLLLQMWDNLGRTAAEFPHMDSILVGTGGRIEVVGAEHITAATAHSRGVAFFSAHCGNWELFGPAAAELGIKLNLVYRAPNNPLLGWMFTGRGNIGAEMIPKGPRGARRALELLREGKPIGMLMDQKMNDGIAVPFFGREAMTAPALAQFALKFGCLIVPSHIVRLGGAHFRLVIEPPLTLPATTDRHEAILTVMTEVNRIIESWIRSHPDQWLWVHRRWSS